MADVAEFGMTWFDELEDNAVGTIDAEAPCFVLFGVQLFYVQRRMKGVGSEQVGLSGCFALNGFGKLLEETIKRSGRRDVDHVRLSDQLSQ